MLKYVIMKEKGTKNYYGCMRGCFTPLTPKFDSQKKALKAAAKLEGMDFKDYMKCYRKECKDDTL